MGEPIPLNKASVESQKDREIRNKIESLNREANLDYSPKNLSKVGMEQCWVIKDNQTTIATYGLETCVALAIAAQDKNGTIYRMISHYPHTEEHFPKNEIRAYLKTLNSTNIKAMMFSMESFKDLVNLNEREKKIIAEYTEIFEFYKKEHPTFELPFKQSWYVKISPQGKFEYATPEMIQVYKTL
jgi:hypothetical protein